MIDHIGITVRSIKASIPIYAGALAPLGYGIVVQEGGRVAFGPAGRPLFWLQESDAAPTSMHIAFVAKDRPAVDRFHAAALAAGAGDHGAPGLRPNYHPHYYGAFVIDPDGNNIEAVCHLPA